MQELNIQMTNRQLEILHNMYVDLLTSWKPDTEMEELLFEHARELERELKVKIAKEVKRPKLLLKRSAARAFWTTWQMVEITGSEYQKMTVQELLNDTDKYLSQPQADLLKAAVK